MFSIPLIPLSALYRTDIHRLRPAVITAYTQWNQHLSTSRLNRWLRALCTMRPHPNVHGMSVKLKFISQVKEAYVIGFRSAPPPTPTDLIP